MLSPPHNRQKHRALPICCAALVFTLTCHQPQALAENAAISIRRQALARDPNSVKAILDLAYAMEHFGDFEGAAPLFKQAYDLPNGKTAEVYSGYINCLMAACDFGVARKLSDEFLQRYPKVSRAHSLRGYVYAQNKEYKKAIAAQRQALQLMPPNSPERVDGEGALGKYLQNDKQWAEAIPYLKVLSNKYPRDFKLYQFIGECDTHTGNYQEALKFLDKALAMAKYDKEVCLARIAYFESLHQYDKAIAEANRLLSTSKCAADKGLLTARSRLYIANGQKALGEKDKKQLEHLDSGMNDLFGPVH